MASPAELAAHYVRPNDIAVAALDATEAFKGLTEKEALYARALYRAAWGSIGICALQASAESVPLLALLRLVLGRGGYEQARAAATAAGVPDADWAAFEAFSVSIIDNVGNYRSFGDTKIVPALPAPALERLLQALPGWAAHAELAGELWAAVKQRVYDLDSPRSRQLGMPPAGTSTYYSSDITKEEAAAAHRFLAGRGQPQPYSTRTFAVSVGGQRLLQVRLASAVEGAASAGPSDAAHADASLRELLTATEPFSFEGHRIQVVRGDYAPLMRRTVAALREAAQHAANGTQAAMLGVFADHFEYGSLTAFVEASRLWVKDVGPAVETYGGMVESYRNPMGVSGEWEWFVAVVNKETSAKFGVLVDRAPQLLQLLPWPPAFEKDEFKRPDFTALEVLAFASSGIPAGVNIPNMDEIRQCDGFKNVSLSNVLRARNTGERSTFLRDADQALYSAHVSAAFEVQVGLHELLGHGSGKVFTEEAPAPASSAAAAAQGQAPAEPRLNFDLAAVKGLDGGPVTSWYKAGETWDSVFGPLASPMEECRAEAVGIFLCTQPMALDIFGHRGEQAHANIIRANWLNMARAGLLALQFWSPSGGWGQAHMQARFVLLRVMLDAGEGFVAIRGLEGLTPENADTAVEGQGGVHIEMDFDKIMSVGVPAVGAFLRKLQVIKSTADVAAGRALFDAVTAVPDHWLPLRTLVISKRKPRQSFVQPILETPAEAEARTPKLGTVEASPAQAAVVVRTFAPTAAGLLDSFAARWPEVDEELLTLWRSERHFHEY